MDAGCHVTVLTIRYLGIDISLCNGFNFYLIKSIRTTLCNRKLKPRCHYDRTYRYKRRQKAVCCSLLSSTRSMGRSGKLSDFKRGLVIGCHISKKSVRDIATLLKLPKSAVGDVIVKWKREGTTTTKPRPDRPRLITERALEHWRRWFVKLARHWVKQSTVISAVLRIVQPASWLCVDS
jgi:hypothetical protein